MPKEYSTKFKTEVIKRYQNGESILALSQELRIAQSTIYHWRKEFCSIKAANRIYTPKEFDALSRRLEKLEHEMEIIKRSGYIADVPLQKKLSVLENIYRQADNTYSVHELCDALDIARGTFYNYIFRRADHSKREEAQIELMRLVQQVFDDSSQRFGAEKIRVTLAGSGVRVSTRLCFTEMSRREKAIQEAATIQKAKSAGTPVYCRPSEPDLGQRYYILQSQ